MTDEERQDSPQEDAAAENTEAPTAPAEADATVEPEVDVQGQEPGDTEDSPSEEPVPAPEPEEPAAEEETPAAEETPAEEPAPEEPAAEDEAPAAEDPAAAETPAAETDAEEAPAEGEERPPRRERNPKKSGDDAEAIPGAHLEPDLVLDDSGEVARDPYADDSETDGGGGESSDDATPQPVATTIIELAADARYLATGKRKSAVARVTIKPGTGSYTVNGKELDVFFPRPTLQRVVRGPLETVGQEERLDVVAKIHGGGVSSQAGALRHGIARALVEADPNLRGELKRRGFLTRDPRVKERKKAGLKKARKRPQFSKR
jgi:small subunit ribosomal protein S9